MIRPSVEKACLQGGARLNFHGAGQIYQLHWEKQQQKANTEMLELLEMSEMLEERAQIENIEMCQRNST